MKKLILGKANFTGAEVLTRAQMKKVTGGTCGVKIGGTWYTVAGGASTASSYLGQSGTINTSNGQPVNGIVTNWCCDSCSQW